MSLGVGSCKGPNQDNEMPGGSPQGYVSVIKTPNAADIMPIILHNGKTCIGLPEEA